MKTEPRILIFQDGDLLLEQDGETCFLRVGEQSYQLSSNLYEPCLFINGKDGFSIAVHHAFTLEELCHTAQSKGSMKMITGNEYDMRGICILLRKALTLSMESVDIGYLEARCFVDWLEECGAISEGTAVSPADRGIKNPNVMNPLLHSKMVKRTEDGRYYTVQSLEKKR